MATVFREDSPPKDAWDARFLALLHRSVGVERGRLLAPAFLRGLTADYRHRVAPRLAVRDCLCLDATIGRGEEVVGLRHPLPGERSARLQIYGVRERSLDEVMPFIENLGLRVRDQVQFVLEIDGRTCFIRSFAVESDLVATPYLLARRRLLLDTSRSLLRGLAENDALNGLVIAVGLDWKEVDVFRGYRNYYFQLGTRFSQQRFHQTLLRNAAVVGLLYRYFEARFRPDPATSDVSRRDEELLDALRAQLIEALAKVSDVNEDRILRGLFNLIDATMRCNFYRRRDSDDYFLAFKIAALGVIDMPAPRPLFEIYVHAWDMEGIHLRGDLVARGGIRWSDRPDDFRSEILELQQTQTLKNAVIVPHGAKGGFTLKSSDRKDRDLAQAGNQAYRRLITGLLDLTDNWHDRQIDPPPQVVVHDGPDPYLVVAADKGTAGFSDTANALSRECGFWLGDAFASGGAHGYNHKHLGITARGAFQCIRRHFRELGVDIDRVGITVVGVGSMDGDVFGNGMLLSRNFRLRGAFGAQHIFLDPDPDPELSFHERRRLFELPGSSWASYDRRLISEGGGVFPRFAKDIPLTPEVRRWLGVRFDSIDGEGLIRLLLSAPVDLLWLGGIGTYVKSLEESNDQVGDRANDGTRVDAVQLRARVVGEGANLGFTQRARVEYALQGGRINTDALDNSAGVDLSDHEVNLKILLQQLHEAALIRDRAERNRILEELTDPVCRAVIAHNASQSLCLSLDTARCRRDPESFQDLADLLENAGLLDRRTTRFPGRKELMARPDRGFTRPELAVLLACSKLFLKGELLSEREFLATEGLQALYRDYFPPSIVQLAGERLAEHPLAAEITASQICNTLIDQAGCSLLVWVEDPSKSALCSLVSCYVLFDRALDGAALRGAIRSTGALAPSRELELQLRFEDALAELCRWGLDRGPLRLDEDAVARWQAEWRQYREFRLRSPQPELDALQGRTSALVEAGLPGETAEALACLDRVWEFPMLVEIGRTFARPLGSLAPVWRTAMEWVGPGLIGAAEALPSGTRDRWERRAHQAVCIRLWATLRNLAARLLESGAETPKDLFASPRQAERRARMRRIVEEFGVAREISPAILYALVSELETLLEEGRVSSEDF